MSAVPPPDEPLADERLADEPSAAVPLPAQLPVPLTVQLRVDGRLCVVVGGGVVGTRRARALMDAGARVVVVDPHPSPAIERDEAAGRLMVRRRDGAPTDLEGAFLVVTATDDPSANAALAAAAGGALVARADDAAASDVLWTATTGLGPVTVAVSTAGAAPAVSAWAADRLGAGLEDVLGADATTLAALVDLVTEVRDEERHRLHGVTPDSPGSPNWRSAIDRTMLDLISRGRLAEAKERLQACRSSS